MGAWYSVRRLVDRSTAGAAIVSRAPRVHGVRIALAAILVCTTRRTPLACAAILAARDEPPSFINKQQRAARARSSNHVEVGCRRRRSGRRRHDDGRSEHAVRGGDPTGHSGVRRNRDDTGGYARRRVRRHDDPGARRTRYHPRGAGGDHRRHRRPAQSVRRTSTGRLRHLRGVNITGPVDGAPPQEGRHAQGSQCAAAARPQRDYARRCARRDATAQVGAEAGADQDDGGRVLRDDVGVGH